MKILKNIILATIICFLSMSAFAKKNSGNNIAIPVTIKDLHEIAIYPENSIPAEVISLQDSVISAEIAGSITEIKTQVGTEVTKDSTIAKIECTDYEATYKKIDANLEGIRADIELTKWQLARNKRLAQKSNISQEKIQQLTASLSKLEANLDAETQSLASAKKNVARCNIKAPYSGLITSKYIHKGEYVTPGTKVVKLINTNEVELDAKVHTMEIKPISEANQNNLLFFNTTGNEYQVKIRSIVPSQDPQTKTQTVRFMFLANRPIPGSSGRLLWRSQHPQIPPEYVQNINNKFGVFVIKAGKASFYELTNAIEGRHVTVDQDFNYPIIVEGRYNVQDGTKIKIVNK